MKDRLTPFYLFERLNAEERQFILLHAVTKLYQQQEKIVLEGEEGQEIFLILAGEVTVTKQSAEQKTVYLSSLKTGNLFGEVGFILNMRRSATVTAKTETKVLVIDYRRLAKANESLAKQIVQRLLSSLTQYLSRNVHCRTEQWLKNSLTSSSVNVKVKKPSSILVMLGWRWKDITREAVFLSRHGFDAIKISPPQEFVVRPGAPWWAVYQPVSYQLSNYYGTVEDFIEMIDFCHSYNLKIYVDLVINHMGEFKPEAAVNQGTNGTEFSLYHYGPLNEDHDYFEYDDFYHYCAGSNKHIQNEDYSSFEGIWRLEHYDFLNLPKLNLTKPHVQQVIRKYVQQLLSFGVDGFRIDAAKHLNIRAVETIFEGLYTRDYYQPYLYQEYYVGSTMGIDLYSFLAKYFRVGAVTAFKYGEFLADALLGRNNNLQKLVEYAFGSSWLHYPEDRAITVIDNHDTERMMDNMLNFRSPNNSYVLAYVFMLAWPFGIPKIMSSFRFKSHDDPYPANFVWQKDRNTCFDRDSLWVAQHRWEAIANMVLFHKVMQNALGVVNVWGNGNQIAFARATEQLKEAVVVRGFVIINATSEPLIRKFNTGLPEGEYYNLVLSDLNAAQITGPVVKVEKYGHAFIEVPPYDAVVIAINFIKK